MQQNIQLIPLTIGIIFALFIWISFSFGSFKLKKVLFNHLPKLKLLRIDFFINLLIIFFSIIIFIIFFILVILYELKMKQKEV
ncbi:hypothetical protein [Mycoplasma phocimorsus]|uniref:hypothetical protein n=1 Tax=Mycoplasma phocimorsus TaxID=3045839 RepID=UPI0024BFAB95|nr:hypothetical protein [Mycoplasma phocimorsus]MDJ1646278.1 hypothetical protein [Mycoplasma phocimorsus]MDJ1646882.1 hypothetical protein [Mycoplasma phocimorsus]MDJ1647849.1 hypothetical protein [Mycoplasma phocimorsus]MDJ1648450.1 hypothetical protein [Mycoplasma phocimorsus]